MYFVSRVSRVSSVAKNFQRYSEIFLCIIVLTTSLTNGQNDQRQHHRRALFETIEGATVKDDQYFWAQTRRNLNGNAGIEEQPLSYYENTDGLIDERLERRHSDYGEFLEATPDMESPCVRGKVCAKREESKAMMVEAIKRNILTQLKMASPPNITVPKISLDSPPLRRIFKKYGIKPDTRRPIMPEPEEEDPEWVDDETSKEKVISYARPLPFLDINGSFFKFNEEDMLHTVTSAVIWVYFQPNLSGKNQTRVEFYRYETNKTNPNSGPKAVKFHQRLISLPPNSKRGHWKNFLITREVTRWFKEPTSNLGIDIRTPDVPDIIMSHSTAVDESLKPMLEVDLKKNMHSKRRKRDLGSLTCTENSLESRCCKYNFEVDFQRMGWNWIISPRQYRSYYCAGDCPYMFLHSNQNKLIALQSTKHPKAASNCCAPTKMSAMSMLYFDNNQNIIYSDVPDMMVNRCGCM